MPMPKSLSGKTDPVANRFGSVIANVMSVGARILGYVIYGFLRMVYRRDPAMIALFLGVPCAIALLVWLILR
jgi:hypothetical protein